MLENRYKKYMNLNDTNHNVTMHHFIRNGSGFKTRRRRLRCRRTQSTSSTVATTRRGVPDKLALDPNKRSPLEMPCLCFSESPPQPPPRHMCLFIYLYIFVIHEICYIHIDLFMKIDT